jgi:hypothetical protein
MVVSRRAALSSSWRIWGRHFTGVILAIGMVSRFLPFDPQFPARGPDALDNAWRFAAAIAAAQARSFGSDIMFTYGPYGAVATQQYSPGAFMPICLAALLLGIAFTGGIFCLSGGRRSLLLWPAPFLLALVGSFDVLMFVVPVIALSIAARLSLQAGDPERIAATPRVRGCLMLLMAALALLALIKVTLAVMVPIMACLIVATLLHGRFRTLAALSVACWSGSFVFLWLMIGQTLQGLRAYLESATRVIAGYSDAMATDGPAWQTESVLAGGCALLLLVALGFARSRGSAGLALLAGVSLVLFLGMKEGLVRHDFFHVPVVVTTIGLLCWVMMFMLPAGYAAASAMGGIAICAMVRYGPPILVPDRIAVEAASGLVAQCRGAAELVIDAGQRRRRFTDAVAAVRQNDSMPALSGAADIYSWDQTALLASGASWDPRPVFQSYAAWTAGLETANAEHLQGPDAPDDIVFRVEPIDDRLASLEDGASWPLLLSRYEPVRLMPGRPNAPDSIWLKRKDRFALTMACPGPDQHPSLGQEVPLPAASRPLWATITLRPTAIGKLSTFLFKAPLLFITLRPSSGAPLTFRFVAGMAESGFLISPLVQDTKGFLAFLQPDGDQASRGGGGGRYLSIFPAVLEPG